MKRPHSHSAWPQIRQWQALKVSSTHLLHSGIAGVCMWKTISILLVNTIQQRSTTTHHCSITCTLTLESSTHSTPMNTPKSWRKLDWSVYFSQPPTSTLPPLSCRSGKICCTGWIGVLHRQLWVKTKTCSPAASQGASHSRTAAR